MTLTTYNEDLCKKIEPNVSTTRERFEVLKSCGMQEYQLLYGLRQFCLLLTIQKIIFQVFEYVY